MITIYNVSIKYSDRYKRYYFYTDNGLLVYLDFCFATVPSDLTKSYDLLGKMTKSPAEGPIFVLMVASAQEVAK